MTGITIKLKTKNGQHVVKVDSTDESFGSLKTKIKEITGFQDPMNILVGFPPKPIESTDDTTSVESTGIKNGDILIVEEKPISVEERRAKEAAETLERDALLAQTLAAQNEANTGILMKKEVPADNSCLFSSIAYVMSGQAETGTSSFMRQIISSQVHSDKHTYNEGMLGKPNDDYCAWIMQDDSWGGAIEVSILSQFYGVEFDVVDITNCMINRFGEDQNYGTRAFLLFDGIHYDPLYLESLSGEPPQTIFPIENTAVYEMALALAEEAKSSRQFTDVQKFTLTCLDCNTMLNGQVQAQAHAKTTGHTNFGEV